MRRLSGSRFTSPVIDILSLMARHLHIYRQSLFPDYQLNPAPDLPGFYALHGVNERRWISDSLKYLSTLCVKGK
jgi:hypothetical protein